MFTYIAVGGKPSQVDRSSIGVQYTEDNRPDFLGYAVANISWERPEESTFSRSELKGEGKVKFLNSGSLN